MASDVPDLRVRALNDAPVGDGAVVYWSTAARRTQFNAALQHAAARARALGTGVWMLEIQRLDEPHASDRFHRFSLDGMQDNRDGCRTRGIGYHGHVETEPGHAAQLLAAAAQTAALVVTDDHPLVADEGADWPCRVEAVDGNGVLPLAATEKAYGAAVHFRRHLQKTLPNHWWIPKQNPHCDGADVPDEVQARWPANLDVRLGALAIDHSVPPVDATGGRRAGLARWDSFDVAHYPEARHPDAHATSGMSPYLRHGHVGAQEMVAQILEDEGWTPLQWAKATGSRQGWWGISEAAEAFLDQLVTWRELGYVDCRLRPGNHAYSTLPDWSRMTLEAHSEDAKHLHSMGDLEAGRTDDDIWNAAQHQLLQEGVIHNYLRMLWGKRILGWSKTPKQALERMLHLNDKWAIDGRDPNSISGIAWVLGRFDRAWGERPVHGKVRYMSSENTLRKLRMTEYLATYGAGASTHAAAE